MKFYFSEIKVYDRERAIRIKEGKKGGREEGNADWAGQGII